MFAMEGFGKFHSVLEEQDEGGSGVDYFFGYGLRRYIVPLLNVYGCPQADGKLEPQKTTAND